MQQSSRRSEHSLSSRLPGQSNTSPNKESKSPSKTKKAEPNDAEAIDINDQVTVIKEWWHDLGANKLNTMKSLKDVTEMFIQRRIFADQSSATKYIAKMTGLSKVALEKDGMEFNDFLSIFLKGILKQVVASVFETVKDFKRTDLWSAWAAEKEGESRTEASGEPDQHEPMADDIQNEKPLAWKLTEFQRQQLVHLLLKTPQDGEKLVKRPVLDNLYNMRYKYDPDKYKNANYEVFLDNHIRNKKQEDDLYELEVDDFAKQINFISSEVDHEEEARRLRSLSSEDLERLKEEQLKVKMHKKEKFDLMRKFEQTFRKAAKID